MPLISLKIKFRASNQVFLFSEKTIGWAENVIWADDKNPIPHYFGNEIALNRFRRQASRGNAPSGRERWKAAVFAGYCQASFSLDRVENNVW